MQINLQVEELKVLLKEALVVLTKRPEKVEEFGDIICDDIIGTLIAMQLTPKFTQEVCIDKTISHITDVLLYQDTIPELKAFVGKSLVEAMQIVNNDSWKLRDEIRNMQKEGYKFYGVNNFDEYMELFNEGMTYLVDIIRQEYKISNKDNVVVKFEIPSFRNPDELEPYHIRWIKLDEYIVF